MLSLSRYRARVRQQVELVELLDTKGLDRIGRWETRKLSSCMDKLGSGARPIQEGSGVTSGRPPTKAMLRVGKDERYLGN